MNKFSVISTIIENALKENIIYGISYSFIKNNNVENYYKGVYGKQEALIILTNRIHTNRHNTKFLELREEINKVFMGD